MNKAYLIVKYLYTTRDFINDNKGFLINPNDLTSKQRINNIGYRIGLIDCTKVSESEDEIHALIQKDRVQDGLTPSRQIRSKQFFETREDAKTGMKMWINEIEHCYGHDALAGLIYPRIFTLEKANEIMLNWYSNELALTT